MYKVFSQQSLEPSSQLSPIGDLPPIPKKSLADTTRLEPAVNSEEKTTGTKNHDSLVVDEESGPMEAIETKGEIQLVNEDDTLEEKYEVIDHDDLVEDGYVVVWEPSSESSRSMRR